MITMKHIFSGKYTFFNLSSFKAVVLNIFWQHFLFFGISNLTLPIFGLITGCVSCIDTLHLKNFHSPRMTQNDMK